MNSSKKLIGTWSYEIVTQQKHWLGNVYDLLNPSNEISTTENEYAIEDKELLSKVIQICAETGQRKSLVISFDSAEHGKICHFVDIRPEFNFHESPDRIIVYVYLKPELDELLLDTASPLNNFHSLFNKKPDELNIFGFDFTCLFRKSFDWRHLESSEWSNRDDSSASRAFSFTQFEDESRQALEKVITEKRFVMTQVKTGEGKNTAEILSIYEPVLTDEQEVLYIYNYIYIITDIRERENIILNQFMAIETAMDGIALLNAKGEYYYVNHSHVKMFGYEVDTELIGKSWHIIYEPAEIERIGTKVFPELMATGKWSGETIGKSKQGEPLLQDISLTNLPNGDLVCVCRDISGRKKQEKQLELNDRILRNTNSIVIITNAKREIEWVNEAFTKIAGYTLEEVVGKNPGKLLQGKDTDAGTIQFMKHKLLLNEPFTCETLNYKKSGEPYWVEIKCQPLFGISGVVDKYFAIQEDISFRKAAEQSVKKTKEQLSLSEERWKFAIDGADAGIWDWDIAANKVYYSEKSKELHGIEGDQQYFEPKDFLGIIFTEDIDRLKGAIDKMLHGFTDRVEIEYRVLNKQKNIRWLNDRAMVVSRNADGMATRIIGIFNDITKKKDLDEKILQTEQRWKFALEATDAGVCDWIVNENRIYYTTKGLEILEYPLSNETPYWLSLAELIFPEDRVLVSRALDRLLAGENNFSITYRIKDTKGGYKWIEDNAMVVERCPEGKARRIVAIFFDITPQTLLQKQLEESEQRWIFALEGSSSGVWDYNLETGAVFYSNKLKELVGCGPDDSFENKISTWDKLVHPDDQLMAKEQIRKYFNGEIPFYENEQRALHKDGTYHWYLNNGIIVGRNEKGEPSRIIGTVTDITSRKQNELDLIKAKEQAEASAKTKRAFLANMSHEIRTPMNAILGLSEQLRQTSLSDDQQFLTNIINDAAKSLQILIDDILDFSKIEEGKLVIENIEFDLHDMMRRIMSMLLHKAQEKNISIQLNFDSSITPSVIGDPNRLSQVLINIIGNAIKFTNKGHVVVTCKGLESNNKTQVVRFSVTDSGIGISEEGLKNIFSEFYQEDQSIARKFGGTGLGLAISHNLISLMKGEIRIESKKNIGTEVEIVLPMEIASPDSKKVIEDEVVLDKSSFNGKYLLLVEDNKVNRIVATIILRKYGFMIDEAENGRIALEMLAHKNYDLVLMDLQMPELDGISTVAVMRKEGNGIPVIALTANAVREELEELLSKGFNDFVIKPFEEKKLLAKIQENLRRKGTIRIEAEFIQSSSEPEGLQNLKTALAKASEHQPAVEERFAAALLFELNGAIENLGIAIGDSDWKQVKSIAHKQKSMLITLDIKDESDTIYRLSAMHPETIVPKKVAVESEAMLAFFEKIREHCLELYPGLSEVSSN